MPGPIGTLQVGCPLWAHAPWRGTFFTRDATRPEFLPQYASVFRTSEGNSTFYGLPAPSVVARWAAEAPSDFRFCLKFPRSITHDLQLIGAEAATREFLHRVAPLGHLLGPFFLQLHASFGPRRLRDLDSYLATLPREFCYAVEVRHPDFFTPSGPATELEAVLRHRGMEWVCFDTRGLFASLADDPFTRDAQRKKPRLPLVIKSLGSTPFIRFVGDPDLSRNDETLRQWAQVVVNWLREGKSPYFFTHHPDDARAPELARRFHGLVCALEPALPGLPSFPAERESRPRQLDLL